MARPEDILGVAPCWVASALEIQHGRPVSYLKGVYVCRGCLEPLEDCDCGLRIR